MAEFGINNQNLEKVLALLYGSSDAQLDYQKNRYGELIDNFKGSYSGKGDIFLFSTSGRTEIGGNHTDHNAGRVLAGAIDLDILAAVVPNDKGVIRIKSERFPMVKIYTADLEIKDSERFSTAALVRGVCARLTQLGYTIGGFDAFTTSNVPNGAGLSSSAAFEVLIVTILNHLYNQGRIDDVLNAKIARYAENEYFGKPCGLMDQMTCAVGGLITIDFKDVENPIVKKVSFDFGAQEYSVVLVAVGGDHTTLNEDYIALEHEMSSIAKALGGKVLREFSKAELIDDLLSVREQVSDRAILRAFHFFDDDQRVVDQVKALENGDFTEFLKLMIASGYSSWMLCQNIFSCSNVHDQGLAVALAMSESLIKGSGAWRVHGGGFAGTIQAIMPNNMVDAYSNEIEAVFGEGSCHRLTIRPVGTVCINKLIEEPNSIFS